MKRVALPAAACQDRRQLLSSDYRIASEPTASGAGQRHKKRACIGWQSGRCWWAAGGRQVNRPANGVRTNPFKSLVLRPTTDSLVASCLLARTTPLMRLWLHKPTFMSQPASGSTFQNRIGLVKKSKFTPGLFVLLGFQPAFANFPMKTRFPVSV